MRGVLYCLDFWQVIFSHERSIILPRFLASDIQPLSEWLKPSTCFFTWRPILISYIFFTIVYQQGYDNWISGNTVIYHLSSPPPVFTKTDAIFSGFELCSQEDLRKIIKSSPSKTCDLDPAPTFLVKDHIDVMLPFLTKLCNATILEGGLPQSQRTAIVVPRLKGAGLDPADVKSHRPISNLSFMSKVIEKVIFHQLVVYLDSNNLVPKYQSGFRKHHSTESATLRVLSDIYSAIDNGKIALLALLDVSAAFDTVDHDILMDRLAESFGIVGQAHDWLSSFITGRTYSVRFGGTTTSPWRVRSGIPQGSILGPLLYILYTADVAALVESLGFKVHLYADDTQLYDSCSPSDAEALAIRVNTAIEAISGWMSSNRLCLNLDKTKYLWFGTRQQLFYLFSNWFLLPFCFRCWCNFAPFFILYGRNK